LLERGNREGGSQKSAWGGGGRGTASSRAGESSMKYDWDGEKKIVPRGNGHLSREVRKIKAKNQRVRKGDENPNMRWRRTRTGRVISEREKAKPGRGPLKKNNQQKGNLRWLRRKGGSGREVRRIHLGATKAYNE